MNETKVTAGRITKDIITLIFTTEDVSESQYRLTWKEASKLVGIINEKIIEKAKYDNNG